MQPINTALLSFGMSGQVFHAPFLEVHPGFTFYAVWERTKELARGKYPAVKTFRSLEDLLADETIELVVVNTPSFTHYQYASESLLAGKHVIVEKPFTATVAEGEELIRLAKERDRKLSVYQNRRFDSDYKVVKEVIENKWLGEILEAEFHYDRFGEELSYKIHKETPGPAVGVVYDLGSHLIDQALQLFGMPSAVFADVRTVRLASKVDDYFEILLYYKNLRVRLHSSYLVREPLPAYILHGRHGSFIKTKSDVQEMALQAGKIPATPDWGVEPASERGLLHTEKGGSIVKEQMAARPGNYMEYYDAIYKALRQQQSLPVTAEEGLDVIKVITAAYQSNAEGRIIDFR